jgi:endonuclease/exonuclease/phosphatase family metal-dependent hydrolase
MSKVRIATFNAENLFSRAKVLNMADQTVGDKALEDIAKLQDELKKEKYDEKAIMGLYDKVKDYITISEDRGKLWKTKNRKIVAVVAKGKGDWDGSVVFKRAKYNEMTRINTAKVIKEVKADLMCIVEAEDKSSLAAFNSQMLGSRYAYNMLIDAMDPRGIDVGLYSNFELGSIRTHMYDKQGRTRIFSRDCLEVEVLLDDGRPLHILCNHLKSKGYGAAPANNAKRKMQAEKLAKILANYDLTKKFVVVLGDFNDTSDSAYLKPLFDVKGLKDVLERQYPNAQDRWTYHYKDNQQIDFMLVSEPLQKAFVGAGVERRGIYNVAAHSTAGEKSFDTVTSVANQASDHGAVWAEFDL